MYKTKKFKPGETYIPVTSKVYDDEEVNLAIEAAKDEWWTEGRFAKQFEREFKKFLSVRYVSLVNSGSSANLIALSALTSDVFGDRKLKPGDEFITTAVGFPTTINPGIQQGLVPVFIDAEIDTFNIQAEQIESAITPKTKLIMIAHTLGKPFNLDVIVPMIKKYNLWLIEDCCDALGSTYNKKLVSSFGHIATYSFYPAHQMTMGEGGAVVTNNPLIHKSIRQFRDWGRDCWCDTGKDNTCGKRFKWGLGELPKGYDHKFIYSQIGYNVKLTDFQAAIGVAQIKKLPDFIKARKSNYKKMRKFFDKYARFFTFMNISPQEDPCWFGFPLVVNSDAPFSRNDLTEYLEKNNIGTRNVFAGNLLRHPAYLNLKKKRIIGKLKNADIIMQSAFWLGVHPGIDEQRMKYIQKIINEFMRKYKQSS
ncbi:lipopolysaccharide biosynthesis protein RfbH [Candidatus Falkowbacteria bacterium CG11_big_fil_rev_8_21_14_0_20_39_10]|uniref:Lipopolysaccharide biosynthesis protein RfbH n=1 Tax=Candidatus Falkowbacteria bacterium CG11_big_fil_rev_8_21_14_0_20_39_10 TaxID=1974570 RepID=A0A2M6K9R6_9BACT|nr:MAG: lipopolysaccharide biosynthesis protein RfbH [Candidatus Falkowbacteria bacterium CG11_big_fil_rev_8_21_14_0_20_39_10]